MNREGCIKILKKSSDSHVSYLEDNQYRYKMANTNHQYDEVIQHHDDELNEYKRAIRYLEENLK